MTQSVSFLPGTSCESRLDFSLQPFTLLLLPHQFATFGECGIVPEDKTTVASATAAASKCSEKGSGTNSQMARRVLRTIGS